MDRMTKEQRSRCMAAIHGKNTRPEMLVRRFLFAQGFRYRVNDARLPGHPDIVLRKYRTIVFINGCFWHGHEGCKGFVLPKSHPDFWKNKIERNRKRDEEELRLLAEMGWRCITIWECELKKNMREQTLASLEKTLRDNIGGNGLQRFPRRKGKEKETDELNIAAEASMPYRLDT